jgi:hypothetical protein
MIIQFPSAFLVSMTFFMASLSVVANADDRIIWRLRDTELRWEKDRKEWERTALLLARSASVDLHLHKVDSAQAAYFEAVVFFGDKVIEYCLVLLRGRDVKGKRAESFVLMNRTPYEGTGKWELAWAIVEPPHPQAPNMDGVLPVIQQTGQAEIWAFLEDFYACPSAQPRSAHYMVMACVVFEDVWKPFIRMATPDKPSEVFDETKLQQPESQDKK